MVSSKTNFHVSLVNKLQPKKNFYSSFRLFGRPRKQPINDANAELPPVTPIKAVDTVEVPLELLKGPQNLSNFQQQTGQWDH